MTTKKNNIKSKSGDKFLTYMLIGFAVAFFVIILSMILFNAFDKTLNYDSFDKLPMRLKKNKKLKIIKLIKF